MSFLGSIVGFDSYYICPPVIAKLEDDGLTLLRLQSRFGDETLVIRVVCPPKGTAVLKGQRVGTPTFKPSAARHARSTNSGRSMLRAHPHLYTWDRACERNERCTWAPKGVVYACLVVKVSKPFSIELSITMDIERYSSRPYIRQKYTCIALRIKLSTKLLTRTSMLQKHQHPCMS